MSRKPYIDDYETYDRLSRDGKVEKEVRYVGSYSVFDSPEAASRMRFFMPLSILTCWVLYFLPLLFFSWSFFRMWLFGPFAVILIPLVLLTRTWLRTRSLESPFTREQSDDFAVWYPWAVGVTGAIGIYCSIAWAITVGRDVFDPVPGDFVYLASSVLLSAVSLILFLRRKSLDTHLIDTKTREKD